MDTLRRKWPKAFKPLFQPARYKACRGGRGSAKSHTFAEALLTRGTQRKERYFCGREIQKSIRDSVKRLLDDKIADMGLGNFYNSVDTEIRGANGTLFLFGGLRSNPEQIKSMEAIDIAWIEEANRMSQKSFDILTPTLRNADSEIWLSWNSDKPSDPVEQMFFETDDLPPRTLRWHVTFRDNPFFPEVLREQLEWDRRRDPDKYDHIWEGGYLKHSEARVFRNWEIEEFETPDEVERFYYGIDWGFSVSPTVAVRCFIDGRTLYIDHEAYRVGCPIEDHPALLAGSDKQEPARWDNDNDYLGIPGLFEHPVTADSARPETIAHMNDRGFKLKKSKKGPDSVKEGVEFLKGFDIKVHPRCTHTIDDLTRYSYKVDAHTDEVLPILVDKDNDCIDALRYALESYRKGAKNQIPSLSIGGGKQQGKQRAS